MNLSELKTAVFLILLISTIYTDLRFKKIYNFFTLPIILIGLALNFFIDSFPGLALSGAGALTGFLILFPFYISGGIGAGDVKFLMAAGALSGYRFLLAGSFYGILLAGAWTIISLLLKKKLLPSLKNVFQYIFSRIIPGLAETELKKEDSAFLPFGVFLALGNLLCLIKNYFL